MPLLLTLIEHIATVLLERGVHFFTESQLHFTPRQNLVMALCFGIAYVVTALTSHPIAHRFGERRVLLASLTTLLIVHTALIWVQSHVGVVIAMTVIGLASGVKWPVIETYIAAGKTPREQLKQIGWFNITWSSTVPVGLGLVGLILAFSSAWLLFAVAAACNVAAIAIAWLTLPDKPVHIEHDHPERPDAVQAAGYWKLLWSSRWSLLSSYTLLFLLAPLLPFVFADLGLTAGQGAWASSVMDIVRVVTFGVMGFAWAGWHDRHRTWPMWAALIGIPIGFAMVLFGGSLTVVLLGEVIFGVAGGVAYFAALYFSMVVKNASVDAGGVHEGIIGTGFVLGPMIGLLGLMLESVTAGPVIAMSLAVAPLILLTAAGAAWPLLKRNRPG